MSEESENLALDLQGLYEVGKYHLPELASYFSGAGSILHETSHSFRQGRLFIAPGKDGSTPGPVAAPWIELRDLLQNIVSTSYDNLTATSDALLVIVEDYASTDSETADQLNGVGDDLGLKGESDADYGNQDYNDYQSDEAPPKAGESSVDPALPLPDGMT